MGFRLTPHLEHLGVVPGSLVGREAAPRPLALTGASQGGRHLAGGEADEMG